MKWINLLNISKIADIWIYNWAFIYFYYPYVKEFNYIVIISLFIHYSLSIFLAVKRLYDFEIIKSILSLNLLIALILIIINFT